MTKISFYNFDINEGYIKLTYNISDKDIGELFFELSPSIRPRNDLIATALSTLCGRVYSEIHYDLEVSRSVISGISKYTLADITVLKSGGNTAKRLRRNNTTLNFSGGFDSLAAKCLMPTGTKLVSMDFGGKFSRERKFFENFDTCIVSTNLLETPLRRNSWSFMGIASILFSDYLDTDYNTFGSIFEAGPNNLSDNPVAAKNISFPPFKIAEMENAPYVLGLTEIGTLNVLGHYSPELVKESLESLATPGEEKRYRKQILSQIAEERLGLNFDLNIIEPPKRPNFKFGQSFTADFLSMYIIKYAGIETASYTISDIPYEAKNIVDKLSLDFYDRVNPNFLENFPKALLGDLMLKLSEANILPYTQKDWEELFIVRSFLSKYHSIK